MACTSYLALLRGINVGGKNIIKMAELQASLSSGDSGLQNVRTYIQSGNILFDSPDTSTVALTQTIHDCIVREFKIEAGVVVVSREQWQRIIAAAPPEWGKDANWKHNILVLLDPRNMQSIVSSIGALSLDIELLVAGEGVLYQSMSRKLFGRTTTGKLASSPSYKQLTVRNYNTAVTLLARLTS